MVTKNPKVKITITIKQSLKTKLRARQISIMSKTGKSYSLSSTTNDILEWYFNQ